MNNRLSIVILLCFLLLVAIMRGGYLLSSLGQNLANTLIHNSFSNEQSDAKTRQRAMALAAAIIEAELPELADASPEDHNTAMLPAALRGLHHHRLDELENAAFWYKVAAQGEPLPSFQQQIMISPWMKLKSSGDFVLETAASEWQIRADTAPGVKISTTDRGTLLLSCSDIAVKPKRAVLSWDQSFDIPYHHGWVIRAKTEIGTKLILASVIDGQLVRHMVETGTGQWEDYPILVKGDNVKYIYLQVREDANSPAESCLTEIDSITFLLDE